MWLEFYFYWTGRPRGRETAKVNMDNLQWEWTTSQACLQVGGTEWGTHPLEFQQVGLKAIEQRFWKCG